MAIARKLGIRSRAPQKPPPLELSRMRILFLQPSVSLTLQSLGRLDALAGCTRYCLDVIPALRSHGLADGPGFLVE